jgi:hypothetical protein
MGDDASKTNLTTEHISYLLDRLVLGGGILMTSLWVTGYYSSTLWVSYMLVLLIALDVILHFQSHQRIVAWLVIGLLAVGGFVLIKTWKAHLEAAQRLAQESDTHGWLIPANDPTPHNPVCDAHLKRILSNSLWVFLGDSVATLGGFDKRTTPLPIVTLGNCELLSISQKNGEISINANIFTPDKFLAVRIQNNEFHLVSQDRYRVPRGAPAADVIERRETTRDIIRLLVGRADSCSKPDIGTDRSKV